MPKLTPAQKQKAKGLKSLRVTERRLADKDRMKPKEKASAPMKGEKTKGITNIIKRRSTQADRVFAKATKGK